MAVSGGNRLAFFLFAALVLSHAGQTEAQQPGSFEALQQAAAQAQEAGNNEQAITGYKQALALRPDWPDGLWALGTLDYGLDRYSDAIPPLTRLVRLAPSSGAANAMLGLSEFEAKDYASAQTHLEKAQSLNNIGDDTFTRVSAYHLALLLNRSGAFDRAMELLHATFPQQDPPAQAKAAMGIALLRVPLLPTEVDPSQDALVQAAGSAAAVVAQGDAQKSVDAFSQLVAQYPNTPYLHEAYASALSAAGKTQQASAARQQETKLAHSNIADLYRIGSSGASSSSLANTDTAWQQAMQNYSTGQYGETITALKLWVKQKPEDGTAWAVMGLSEFELRDYDNALIHLQRGQQLGVGASRQAASVALYHLALLLNRSGSFDAATSLLASIVEFPPVTSDAQYALGLSLLHMRTLPADVEAAKRPLVASAGEIASLLVASKYDTAFPLFQKLIAQYPAVPFLHYAFGTALESLSQYDEAKTQMREEVKLSPQSALPWTRIASISLKQHLPADALPAARTAIQLAPDSADAHYILGRAYLEAGDTQQAVSELEKAVSTAPDSPEPHFALARAYTKANMMDKAAQERASFARLNALAEQQRAANGSQAYQGPREASGSSILGAGNASGSAHPQQR